MAPQPYFSPTLFRFLRELRDHNDRSWFQRNKARYIAEVREPMLRFIQAFAEPLGEINPHFLADPRPQGGSMFRIHRDTRFSRDKSPYKTNVGAQFRHETAKDAHRPGFYLHLEPGRCFAAAGLWHPDSETLGQVREAIVARAAEWRRITTANDFTSTFELVGDSLRRAPRGYDPGHPLIVDLKRKDFVAVAAFTEAAACAPDVLPRYAALCRKAAPLVGFLTRAVGAAW